MERLKFEFDHELAAQLRAGLEKSTRDAATEEYRKTTEWMLRAAAKLVLRIVVGLRCSSSLGGCGFGFLHRHCSPHTVNHSATPVAAAFSTPVASGAGGWESRPACPRPREPVSYLCTTRRRSRGSHGRRLASDASPRTCAVFKVSGAALRPVTRRSGSGTQSECVLDPWRAESRQAPTTRDAAERAARLPLADPRTQACAGVPRNARIR